MLCFRTHKSAELLHNAMALHAEPMFMLDLRKGEKLDHQTLYVENIVPSTLWYCGHLNKPKGVLAFVTIESCWIFQ